MFAILIGLGVWQVRRLHWKLGLLAAIDRAEAAPPAKLSAHPRLFEKVEVRGRMLDDKRAFFGSEVRDTTTGSKLGEQLIMPLERASGPPVLIDRGWVPDGAPAPVDTGEVRVVGYVRPAEHPSWFTPASDLNGMRFYALDPEAIGAALGLAHVAPFTVIALGPESAAPVPESGGAPIPESGGAPIPATGGAPIPATGGAPIPATALPRPPNNHLGYAVTWFGLAVCLVLVFVAYARKTLRA
jgi:surfeit locus 1 family protein